MSGHSGEARNYFINEICWLAQPNARWNRITRETNKYHAKRNYYN
jgi:hypothetical protein